MAVLEKEEMLELTQKTVDLAQRGGADEAEAYAYQGLTTNIMIERGQINRSSRIVDRGLGIRAIVRKAVGFSYTNVVEKDSAIEETVLKAVGSARASRPDPDWHELTAKRGPSPVKGTYDGRIAELDSTDLVGIASTMLETARRTDTRVLPIEGEVGASYLSKAIANTSDVEAFDRGTIVECSLATLAKDAGEVTPVCFEFDISREYTLKPEWVGEEAARIAVSALKARKTSTRKTNVLFAQFALQQLLHFTLINAVRSDFVQRNQSAFKGKIGDRVASEIVTIHDDGLLDGGIRTSQFDGEGVPRQKTTIIEKGVLRSFIYDNYTARKEERESTGNAARAGYLSTPSVEPSNFHILRGNTSPDELLAEMKDGVLVNYLQGAHSSNPASGEFSVVATPAWEISNGHVSIPLKGAMLAGNIFQFLEGVSALGSNERKIGQLVAPWVLVRDLRVIGHN